MSDDEINYGSAIFIDGGWYVPEEKYRDDINRLVVRVNEVRAELPSPDADNPEHLRFAASVLSEFNRYHPSHINVGAMRNLHDGADKIDAEVKRDRELVAKVAMLIDGSWHVAGLALAQQLYDAGLLADGDSDV